LTHPVRWGRARLTALQEAAKIAGFARDQIRLLPEPIAALHAHVPPGSLPPGSRVAVVDTGGGTCDIAVLQTTDDPSPGKDLLVVAQEGDDRLGGNDLDNLLYEWVLSQLRTAGRTDMVAALADAEHLGATLTLLDVVRAAKQDLSEHTNAPVGVAVRGQETTLTVTREEYEDLIAEPMSRAGALTSRALQASGTTNLAGLYLTGGTAYTPALAQVLHKVTGILTAPLGDPKLAVAVGALKTPVAVMTPAELTTLAQQLAEKRREPRPPAPATAVPAPGQSPPPQSFGPQAQPQSPAQPAPQPQGPAPQPAGQPQGPGPQGQPQMPPRQAASGPPRVGPGQPSGPPPSGPPSGPAPSAPPPAGQPSAPYPASSGYRAPAPTPARPPTTGYQPMSGQPQGYGYAPPPHAPRPAQGSGNAMKIALGAVVGLIVLGGVGFGVWWFALRSPATSATCWDGTTVNPCPAFDGRAAVLHAFKPKEHFDTSVCQTNEGYLPTGWTYSLVCPTSSAASGEVYITQWPSTQAARSGFVTAYEEAGTWENTDGEVLGTSWRFSADAHPGQYLHVYCYDDVPFCLEAQGPDSGPNPGTDNFRSMSRAEVQAMRDYLASR
ncbi:MAG: Hsp70 family protein, partial [Micrococcales bacterium]|nr:Hsp70 family protein [Micrococcales bacterium]